MFGATLSGKFFSDRRRMGLENSLLIKPPLSDDEEIEHASLLSTV